MMKQSLNEEAEDTPRQRRIAAADDDDMEAGVAVVGLPWRDATTVVACSMEEVVVVASLSIVRLLLAVADD